MRCCVFQRGVRTSILRGRGGQRSGPSRRDGPAKYRFVISQVLRAAAQRCRGVGASFVRQGNWILAQDEREANRWGTAAKKQAVRFWVPPPARKAGGVGRVSRCGVGNKRYVSTAGRVGTGLFFAARAEASFCWRPGGGRWCAPCSGGTGLRGVAFFQGFDFRPWFCGIRWACSWVGWVGVA